MNEKLVYLLNLMPEKESTDRDFVDVFRRSGVYVKLVPLCFRGMRYKTTPQTYVDLHYLPIEELIEAGEPIERLIVTGAPLEQMDFEDCSYWEQLCRVMDWAQNHASRTLYICWGAQAALYHYYGIRKRPLSTKCFGIFEQEICSAEYPLFCDFPSTFQMPHSRHTEVRREDIEACTRKVDAPIVLAEGSESGISVVANADGSLVFVTGHLEYNAGRLDFEYRRDLSKGLPIAAPLHYYEADGVTPCFAWGDDAARFYRNWVRE